MEDIKLAKLKELLKVIDDSLTREEFNKSFADVLKALIKLEQNLVQRVDKRLGQLKDGKDGQDGKDGIGIKGEKGDKGDSIIGNPGKDGKDGSPDTAEDIRNKLELLFGDDRLDASAIKGLDEWEKRLRGVEGRPNVGGWSSAGGGKIVKSYDLSASLNGVLTTFSLPAFWRVISVHLSSYPNILQPITDYTTDTSAMTITFNSTIQPSTSLAAGQTLLVVYAEP